MCSLAMGQSQELRRYHFHHEVSSYSEELAIDQDQVKLFVYGESPQGRPLQLLAFGSPTNLANLDAIQANQLARAEGKPTDPAFDHLAVVWLSYDVHGNEASCTEAAMEVMAELADPNSQRAMKWFERLVILVDPCLNPDGHDRYVHFIQQRATSPVNPHPSSWSHVEPWPGGRLNHYLFDLNRDWAWARQSETQSRLKVYQTWLPHVHADYHEMGYDSPYYFAPAAAPYHTLITPWQRQFQELVGAGTARDFDERNERYFTREDFDLFYPSYGDTYPMFRGAIGMTYEQGGGPRSGLAVRTENGKTLTLAQRVLNHVQSSFALLDVSWEHAQELIDESSAFFNRARTGSLDGFGAYILKAHQPELDQILPFLDLHGIQYGHAPSPKKAASGFDYLNNELRPVTWDSDDWIIPANQPHGALLQALMDPAPALEDSLTYDITAWALPFSYGIHCYGVNSTVAIEREQWSPSIEAPLSEGAYAHLVTPNSAESRAFIARAGEAGLQGRLLTKASEFENQSFPPGTVCYLSIDQNLQDWESTLEGLRPKSTRITSIQTGHSTAGLDMGSDGLKWMPFPRIAVLGGDAVRALSLGEIWWHFEKEWRISPTIIDANRVPDWKEFDVVILPDGIGRSAAEGLEDFAKQGGTIVALGDAVDVLAKWESTSITAAFQSQEEAEDPLAVPYADRNRHWATRAIEGAIFELAVDPTHPIGYLEGAQAFALKQGRSAWLPLDRGNSIAVYRQDAPISGHVGYQASKGLGDRLAIGSERIGSGQVIYFVDNPLFRGFWEEGKAYFDRAVLFSPTY